MPRRITCTGYGVGGALATVAACWAAGKFATADVRCVTLAAPRAGNKAFKKVYENLVGATYRVVLEGDATAMVPKDEGLLKKYAHVGHPVWLTDGEVKYEVRPLRLPLAKRCADLAAAAGVVAPGSVLASCGGAVATCHRQQRQLACRVQAEPLLRQWVCRIAVCPGDPEACTCCQLAWQEVVRASQIQC